MSAKTKRPPSPETDNPEWAAWQAAARLTDVEYVGRMEAIVFRLEDGRIFGLSLPQLGGLDASPVTRVSLLWDGDATLVEQFSGNRVEIPRDTILCSAGFAGISGVAAIDSLERVGGTRSARRATPLRARDSR